ncbi:single-stranded-DNA-specific exonuclease RecJ, partial [Patescibacteria group bacterium]|nr:single-stranded-DNA-specific exonuclease RecJ [Patescibacteria group bacterium]
MKWKVKDKAPDGWFKQFPEFTPLITQLLYNRGLISQKQIDEFFNPDYSQDFHDPYLLKGMKKAVNRIKRALKNKEKITIYGDFDADGVCATTILFLTLKELGAKKLDAYIPDREKENHGFNDKAIRELKAKETNLIVAVDCGSTDFKEVDLAKSLGIDVIITDHHLPGEKLPQALAVVNPFQIGDKYPFKELSGAGVAFKLASALLSDNGEEFFQKWLLDLVALATVVDVMPIIGENRTLVKYGLGVLAQTQRAGLRELMKIGGVEPKVVQESLNGEAPTTNLNVSTLGFVLGPRLNVASRMDHANTAFHLLITQDQNEAEDLAKLLNEKNIERQNLTAAIMKELEKRIKDNPEKKNLKIIFESSPDWPVGLVGLIASKLVDKYSRPAMICRELNGLIHVSCRSISKFDLMEAIGQAVSENLLDDYGGHKGGAGFRAKKENLEKIRELFIGLAEEKLTEEDLVPTLDIDTELSWNDINFYNHDEIQKFAPFGKGNPEPKFLIKALEVKDLRAVG